MKAISKRPLKNIKKFTNCGQNNQKIAVERNQTGKALKYIISEPQQISTGQEVFDPETGLSKKGNGGSELMYRAITNRLGSEYLDKFQIISSRVRNINPDKKRVLWLHDTFDDPENQHLKNAELRKRFSKLVFVSNYQFTTFNLALGVPYGESVILRNAIEPIETHSKPDSSTIRLIYHTTPHRGLELLVPVFLELEKIRPNISLDVYSSFEMYGWGHRDEPYKELFEVCRNHPKINYHGFAPNSQIREALKSAHIFAYPSIWQETSCIAAIEALSAGCVVVAPDLAALSETLNPFGIVYRWNENIRQHMATFGNNLLAIIDAYNSDGMKKHLTNQVDFANTYYNIDDRVAQWKQLLNSL